MWMYESAKTKTINLYNQYKEWKKYTENNDSLIECSQTDFT